MHGAVGIQKKDSKEIPFCAQISDQSLGKNLILATKNFERVCSQEKHKNDATIA